MFTRNLASQWRLLHRVERGKEFALVHDGAHGLLGYHPSLAHLLERKDLLLFLFLYLPNFSESATPDHVLELKVVLGDS